MVRGLQSSQNDPYLLHLVPVLGSCVVKITSSDTNQLAPVFFKLSVPAHAKRAVDIPLWTVVSCTGNRLPGRGRLNYPPGFLRNFNFHSRAKRAIPAA